MSALQKKILYCWLVCLACVASSVRAAENLPFREATFEKGRLKYVQGIPVLTVEGTPEEIGRQKAALTVDAAKALSGYPQRLLKLLGREDDWPKMVALGHTLLPQFPADHLAEIRAFGRRRAWTSIRVWSATRWSTPTAAGWVAPR